MGSQMSVEQKEIYRDFKFKLAYWGKKLEKKELQILILLACENSPEAIKDKLFLVDFWEEAV